MRLPAAESQIMEALWARSPMSADEIVAEVSTRQAWGEATIKTLINRLLKRKAIKSEREAGRHQYRPLIERADYVQAESQGLLDRLFEGQLAPLIAHFAEHRALKPEEVERLKRLIDKMGEQEPDSAGRGGNG